MNAFTCCLFLVNGTSLDGEGAESAEWANVRSDLQQKLNACFEGRSDVVRSVAFEITTVPWRQGNTEKDRIDGAKDLADLMRESARKNIPYALAGYSHGGTVCRYALEMVAASGDDRTLRYLHGLFTIGTPFFPRTVEWFKRTVPYLTEFTWGRLVQLLTYITLALGLSVFLFEANAVGGAEALKQLGRLLMSVLAPLVVDDAPSIADLAASGRRAMDCSSVFYSIMCDGWFKFLNGAVVTRFLFAVLANIILLASAVLTIQKFWTQIFWRNPIKARLTGDLRSYQIASRNDEFLELFGFRTRSNTVQTESDASPPGQSSSNGIEGIISTLQKPALGGVAEFFTWLWTPVRSPKHLLITVSVFLGAFLSGRLLGPFDARTEYLLHWMTNGDGRIIALFFFAILLAGFFIHVLKFLQEQPVIGDLFQGISSGVATAARYFRGVEFPDDHKVVYLPTEVETGVQTAAAALQIQSPVDSTAFIRIAKGFLGADKRATRLAFEKLKSELVANSAPVHISYFRSAVFQLYLAKLIGETFDDAVKIRRIGDGGIAAFDREFVRAVQTDKSTLQDAVDATLPDCEESDPESFSLAERYWPFWADNAAAVRSRSSRRLS